MSTYNVLVVEDSPTMRQLIVFALKRIRGLNITEANDGVDGLKKISAEKFDLILTDINMPIMDGTKVIEELRAFDATAQVPVIALTGMADTQMRDDMYERGVDAYVTKPIDFAVLLAKVSELAG